MREPIPRLEINLGLRAPGLGDNLSVALSKWSGQALCDCEGGAGDAVF